MANTRRKRRSADERCIAAAKLVYREGISDEAVRRTAIYQHLMDGIKRDKERKKMLREDRMEAKHLRPHPRPREGSLSRLGLHMIV